jgi:hypothetical protein
MDFALIEQKLRPNYHKFQTNKIMSYVGLSPQLYFQFLARVDVNIYCKQ